MDINLTLISQALAFAAFIWFTVKFIWPPLLTAIENRQKEISEGLVAAERGKHELELAHRRASEILQEAKHKSSEIIAQAEKRASQVVEEAKGTAKDEGNRLIEAARAEIQQEVFRAREALRQQVTDLAVAGAEKILRREIDVKAHGDLLEAIEAEL
jgi:F-type H+-transporting ATPase subunit b